MRSKISDHILLKTPEDIKVSARLYGDSIVCNSNSKKFISQFINNSQQRIEWYKSQLQEVHRFKDLYPDWYREFLRDCKNMETVWIKTLQEESYWIGVK